MGVNLAGKGNKIIGLFQTLSKARCPRIRAQSGLGTPKDSLRLVRCLCRPMLAGDALAGLVDQAAVLLPCTVVAVCGGRTKAASVPVLALALRLGASSPSSVSLAPASPSGGTSSVQRLIW